MAISYLAVQGFGVGAGATCWAQPPSSSRFAAAYAQHVCAAAATCTSSSRCARALPGPLLQCMHMPQTVLASHEYKSSKLAIWAGGHSKQSKGPGGAMGHRIELVFAAFEAATA